MTPQEALAAALQYPVLQLAGYLDTTTGEFTEKLAEKLSAAGYSIVATEELEGLRRVRDAARPHSGAECRCGSGTHDTQCDLIVTEDDLRAALEGAKP